MGIAEHRPHAGKHIGGLHVGELLQEPEAALSSRTHASMHSQASIKFDESQKTRQADHLAGLRRSWSYR
ncbi:hypothetical protein B1L11_38930 [Microbispora sp. GKU 823]|nr:hypothetical protein B1L11_38930 [Microbispora sp. GKU 823]